MLLDDGLPLAAACRIVTLEDRLAAAHRRIVELGGTLTSEDDAEVPTQTHAPALTSAAADPLGYRLPSLR
jgi:hypothetical protein